LLLMIFPPAKLVTSSATVRCNHNLFQIRCQIVSSYFPFQESITLFTHWLKISEEIIFFVTYQKTFFHC
jgi:hypothetical protein